MLLFASALYLDFVCGRSVIGEEKLMGKVNEITRQDILQSPYSSNPNVHTAISLWIHGGCTWEQAMMYCVISLAGQVELLEDRVKDKISKEPAPNWNAINSLLGRK